MNLRVATARAAVAASAVLGAGAMLATLAWRPHPLDIVCALIAATFLPVTLVGAAAVQARSGGPIGWILLAAGVSLPLGTCAYACATGGFANDVPGASWAGWFDGWPWVPGVALIPTVGILLFPTGRLPSRRWWPVLIVDVLVLIALLIWTVFGSELIDFPGRPNPLALPGSGAQIADALLPAIALIAPLSTLSAIAATGRFRAQRGTAAGSALRLVLPAAWSCAVAWWSCVLFVNLGGDSADIYAAPLQAAGMLAVAVTCWAAIRRYGLLDVRTVVSRAAVYTGLTIAVVLVYLLVATVVGAFARPIAGPLAVGIAVLAALPARQVLQRGVNRLLFGYRDDPGGALRHLGERLADIADAAEMLSGVAQVVKDVLRVRRVVVEVQGRAVAQAGHEPLPPEEPPLDLPLVFAGETIGRLVVAPGPGRRLTLPERELLAEIAQRVASVAHAVFLSEELSRSRERLVAATEEERRRLRRDLHDGLGPALAGVALGLHRARGKVAGDPAAATAQLDQLAVQVQGAVADVRRLVYGLRPPALDELGLVAAIDEQARALGGVQVEGALDDALPAAVEVAAYRIALEAMTNAVRHSGSRSCWVSLELNGALHLIVEDDGIGLPEGYRAGVGITSMRERATELGGTCLLERREPTGTLVHAVLPVRGTA
ncbi:sensor histidine kinase [Cryptosporangium sp. NPDC051539]|uniref:sensor histidine kinase n=1 Tax=Cryptosporangium sp. NPDC051539 TaxID=3363962 RepID=UPI003788DC8E